MRICGELSDYACIVSKEVEGPHFILHLLIVFCKKMILWPTYLYQLSLVIATQNLIVKRVEVLEFLSS